MPTWMVVEDEPDIYDVLLAMFEIWGIEGVAFVDGGEAVAWIEDVDKGSVAPELPELAILDIRLPEVPGPEVGARLRKSDRLGRIAIVMITAYRLSPAEEEQVKARAQADTLMYKPLPAMPELRKILDEIISRRRALPRPESVPQAAQATRAMASNQPMVSPPAPPAPSAPSTPSVPSGPSAPPGPSTPSGGQSTSSTTPPPQPPSQPSQPARPVQPSPPKPPPSR